jgi:hypothetical protein
VEDEWGFNRDNVSDPREDLDGRFGVFGDVVGVGRVYELQ